MHLVLNIKRLILKTITFTQFFSVIFCKVYILSLKHRCMFKHANFQVHNIWINLAQLIHTTDPKSRQSSLAMWSPGTPASAL